MIKIHKKILMVFGTRPEAIKLVPLIYAFGDRPKSFNLRICSTSQHRTMLEDAMKVFDITVHYKLDIMHERQHVSESSIQPQSSSMLSPEAAADFHKKSIPTLTVMLACADLLVMSSQIDQSSKYLVTDIRKQGQILIDW